MKNLLLLFSYPVALLVCAAAQTTPKAADAKVKSDAVLGGQYQTVGVNIPELLNQPGPDVVIRKAHLTGMIGGPLNPAPYPPHFLKSLACTSDAVIVGTIRKHTSQVSEAGDFIYSDYVIQIQEVLKDSSKSPVAPNATVLVSRPGGSIKGKYREVRAVDPNFRSFKEGGRYLLFLKYAPAASAYIASAEGSFDLNGKTVRQLTRQPLWKHVEDQEAGSVISDARAAADSVRAECGGGGGQ